MRLYYVSIIESAESDSSIQKRIWADSAQKAADKIREFYPKAIIKSVALITKCNDWK